MPVLGIYSFPKSGNTWVRSIIGALFPRGKAEVPDLHQSPLSDSGTYNGFRFYKHHSGRLVTEWKGETLDTTHIIHIRRNPLDVFLSYMNFQSRNVSDSALIPYDSVDEIKGTLLFDMYFHTFITTGHVTEFQQVTRSYFANNQYWINYAKKHPNVACIKYEDLFHNAEETLGFLKEWLSLEPGQLRDMLETASGVTTKDGKFYWKQQEKNFLNYLTKEQIELFLEYRGKDTARIGYDRDYFLT